MQRLRQRESLLTDNVTLYLSHNQLGHNFTNLALPKLTKEMKLILEIRQHPPLLSYFSKMVGEGEGECFPW